MRSRREKPPAIDAGSFLEIGGVRFVPQAGGAELHFAYPDLALVGHATLARVNQRWRVASLLILPLEKIADVSAME